MSVETEDPKDQGLYGKYVVTRMGESEPIQEAVFVLKPDTDVHARRALIAYANSARSDGFEKLADDIHEWIGAIRTKRLLEAVMEERDKKDLDPGE